MLAGEPVLMKRLNIERSAKERASYIDRDGLGPALERVGYVYRHALVLDWRVRLKVLSLEVGVDRHLRASVSGERRNEIERHHPTTLAR
jgi:hypothetical protein